MADKKRFIPQDEREQEQKQEPDREAQQIPTEQADGRDGVMPEIMRRQSAPRQTVDDALMEAQRQAGALPLGGNGMGGMADMSDMMRTEVIGTKQVQDAVQTLQKYKTGKANLERRIVENEEWYKLRSWECMRREKQKTVSQPIEPTSGWLFNSIANKLADFMDSYPAANVLPREESDAGEAKALTSIIPVVMEQIEFEQTYHDVAEYKLKHGTGVYGVFWDANESHGLGNINVKRIDLLNLFWEPGIADIQDSPNLFYLTLADNERLEGAYPQLKNKLGSRTLDIQQYMYDDSVDVTGKSVVVDWYYKKQDGNRTILHYVKFVNDEVLFATENKPDVYPLGWYEHGEYPFVFDSLFRTEGTPCGFGYIDIGKSPQEYIDRLDSAILQNCLFNAKPRHFIRDDGSVNEAEYADTSKDFIHVDGNLGQDSVIPVQVNQLPAMYVNVLESKINEIKETTGNRDVSTGGTTSGVTAASGIAALQEASGKLSRMHNKSAYRAFRRVVYMVIEMIRQFYELPRWFRILGERGAKEYIMYSNAGIKPQTQGGNEFGVSMGYRVPEFDIEVTAEKANPYSKMERNELALAFYQAGFFNPQMADQALACLDMMDFDHKQEIVDDIQKNGTMYQMILQMQSQMLQMAQIIDGQNGTNMAEQMAMGVTGQPVQGAPQPLQKTDGKKADISSSDDRSGGAKGAETRMNKARQETAERTEVR